MNSSKRIAPPTLTLVDSSPRVSQTLINACAQFCVIPHPTPDTAPRTARIDHDLIERLQQHRIVQIVGPSGAGKTSLIRALTQTIPASTQHCVPQTIPIADQPVPVFDLLLGDVNARAAALSMSGLAEPRLWAQRAHTLSTGEQARLRIAITMQRAAPGDVVFCDEFASTIDRASAYALCSTVRRWAHRKGITLIAASAHEDLEPMLAPDIVIDATTGTTRSALPAMEQDIRIEQGTKEDYLRLAHLHYRGGTPASMTRVLRAVRETPGGNLLAGVLVVSMPMLNSVWRPRAWGDRYSTGNKSLDAKRLNEDMRMISRVIIDPRSRGLGIATRLARAYLASPETPRTEAIAAMGHICPFFDRAGMIGYDIPPDLPDTRLLDTLTHLGLTPESLMHARITPGSLLEREIRSWGKQRKLLGPGPVDPESIQRLTPTAACRLCSRPRAYAFTKGGWGDDPPEH
jgi:ABC-type cobalamin/Fe3+-siderophores transport system ATPase subunit